MCFGYPKVRHEDVRQMTAHTFKKRIPEDYPAATEIRTVTRAGMRVRERVYKDADAESLRQAIAEGLLNQAVGRIRPYGNENAVLLIHTKAVSEVSNAAVLYAKADLEKVEAFSEIGAVVSARETARATGDVQAIMETEGVSERTAYRRRGDKGKVSKAQREKEICRRYANGEGETQKEIAEAFDISERTVKRILKKAREKHFTNRRGQNCQNEEELIYIKLGKNVPLEKTPRHVCLSRARSFSQPISQPIHSPLTDITPFF